MHQQFPVPDLSNHNNNNHAVDASAAMEDDGMSDYFDPRSGGAGAGGSSTAWQQQQSRHHRHHQHQRHQQYRSGNDSWVEIDSQPSSSSVSSVNNEIITTGLRVGGSSPSSAQASAPRRRRMSQQPLHPIHQQNALARAARAHAAGTSSQEDETESEDDRVASSTEHVHVEMPRSSPPVAVSPPVMVSDVEAYADDSDDNATALGRAAATSAPASRPAFRPEPNAFSHPPAHLAHRHSLPSQSQEAPRQRRTSDSRFQRRSVPNNMGYNPSSSRESHASPYREDNDAVLRASLTTLLSYATAARGLPKPANERSSSIQSGPRGPAGPISPSTLNGPGASRRPPGRGPSSQPVELALVPESEIPDVGEAMPAATVPNISAPMPPSRQRQRPSSPKRNSREKPQRSSTASPSSGSNNNGNSSGSRGSRATKKKRLALLGGDEALISPTVLTWVVGASVVVFFSVVGFGAGYVIGREAGRQEAFAAGVGVNASASSTAARVAAESASSCGRQAAVTLGGGGGAGLRKLRWGSTLMASSVVA
jgi:hypothetical protein